MAYIENILTEYERGRRNFADQIYAVMMFKLWLLNAAKKSFVVTAPEVSASPRAMTILVCSDIIPCDNQGGSGRVAWELALQLLKKGHKVFILTKGSTEKKDFEVIEGVEVYRYYGNPFKCNGVIKRILKAHKRIDVLELHHPYTAFWAIWLLKGVPAVYNFHSPWAEEFLIRSGDLRLNAVHKALGSATRKFMERSVLKSSKIILSDSQFMDDKLNAAHKIPSRIVPLDVDTEKFSPAEDITGIRRKFNIPDNSFAVFTVRNLVTRMGLENLVEAAAKVVKEKPEVFFIMGGRGYLHDKLERLIAERGLSNHVRMEGYISESDLPLYYQCADLFILPTRLLEGFGLVTLEAMACGTPVLATPVAANIDVLGKFDKNFLLDGIEPENIAEGIIKFMLKYEKEKKMIRLRCRQFIEENFSWKKYATEVEKIFYEAIG